MPTILRFGDAPSMSKRYPYNVEHLMASHSSSLVGFDRAHNEKAVIGGLSRRGKHGNGGRVSGTANV